MFYETGYAHALGKPTILLAKNIDDIPFDLKHHYHIIHGGRIGNLARELEPRVRFFSENLATNIHLRKSGLAILVNGRDIIDRSNVFRFRVRYGDPTSIALELRIENPTDKHIQTKQFQPALQLPRELHLSGLWDRNPWEINGNEAKYGEFHLADGQTKVYIVEEMQRLLPGSLLDMVVRIGMPAASTRPRVFSFPMAVRVFLESIPEEYPFTVVVETEPSPTQHQSDRELSVPHVDVSE